MGKYNNFFLFLNYRLLFIAFIDVAPTHQVFLKKPGVIQEILQSRWTDFLVFLPEMSGTTW